MSTKADTRAKPEERVVVTTVVGVRPAAAFDVFTREIHVWWRRAPRYHKMPGQSGTLAFEGAPPDKLVERTEQTSLTIGKVLVWQPGERLAFAWYGAGFNVEDGSEVEVRFENHRRGTRVTLEHKGLSRLPLEHGARKGFSGEAFEAMLGHFWGELLASYRTRSDQSA